MAAKRRRRFFHASDYALNDDLPGVRLAKKRGYLWIDLNGHVTKDNRVVITHWRYPLQKGWRDPKKKIPSNRPVDQMTLAEVQRLRNRKRPGARIRTASQVFRACKKLRLSVEFEAKDSPAFAESDEPWIRLKALADSIGLRVEVKSLVWLGRGWQRLDRARKYFFTFPIGTTAAAAKSKGYRYYR